MHEIGITAPSKENQVSKGFGIASAMSFALIAVLFAISLTGNGGRNRNQLFKSAVVAADSLKDANPEHVGSKKCRICHLGIYESWQMTAHAQAMDPLGSENRDSVECLECHTTGVKADGTLLPGVGCEACHGPGSEYRKMRIMKNKELAVQHGLLVQTEAVCVGCHNEKSPTFKQFNYSETNIEDIHTMPSAGE